MAHSLADAAQPIERADSGQDVGTISALFATSFEPAPLLEQPEQGIQQCLLLLAGDQPVAEGAQN